MLVKKWIVTDLMGCIIDYGSAQFDTEDQCKEYIAKIGGWGLEPLLTDVNVSESTMSKDAFVERFQVLIDNGLVHFSLSLMPGFLAMPMDERIEFILQCINPKSSFNLESEPYMVDDEEVMAPSRKVKLSEPWDVIDGKIVNI